MRTFGIARRMNLFLAAFVGVNLATIFAFIYLQRSTSRGAREMVATARMKSQASFALLGLVVQLQGVTQRLLSSNDPDAIEAMLRKNEELVKQGQAKTEEIAGSDSEVKDSFTALVTTNQKVQDLLLRAQNIEARQIFLERSNPAFESLLGSIKKSEDREVRSLDEEAERQSIRASRLQLIIFLLAGTCELFLVGLGMALGQSVTGSLGRVVDMVRDIAEGEGDLTKRLAIASSDEIGELARLFNSFLEKLQKLIARVAGSTQGVADSSEQLTVVGQQMSANAEETSAQANLVSEAAEHVNRNLQTVASGTNQMTESVKEIAKNASEAARVATEAVGVARETNSTVEKLGQSSLEIGKVVKVITAIAGQTNLLALNATIEAARAGEAGKGFAVVANEVKELAKQTAEATEEISRRIQAIQEDTKGAVQAIRTISGVIDQVNNISGTIAMAVEKQNATTDEMARHVSEAARGSGEIAQNIIGVAEAARGTSQGAADSQKAAHHLAAMSSELRDLVGRFKV